MQAQPSGPVLPGAEVYVRHFRQFGTGTEMGVQGWARDVKARDREAHLPRPRCWLHQLKRDRDETLKFRDEMFVARNVIETFKYKF